MALLLAAAWIASWHSPPSLPSPLRRLPPRRTPLPTASLFPEPWMNRLGTATASRATWARARADTSLDAGAVLLASDGSYDHYFRESLVLLLEHSAAGSRGLLLNHQTPWKVDELASGALPPFAANTVFLGGDAGRDTLLMVHGEHELPGAREVGRGVYAGGVEEAAAAVSLGALPADRFKFFYKTVEWLPGQLEAQVEEGLFRLVELAPAWLFGQHDHRSMWEEVHEQLRAEEAAAAAAKAAEEEEEEEEEEERRGREAAAAGEGGGLAAEASEAAARMRRGKAGREEARAQEAHDAKTRALVEALRAEEAAGVVREPFSLGPNVAEEKARFEARLKEVGDQLSRRYETAAPPPAAAEEAAAWLAARGITPPPAEKPPPMSVDELLALSEAGSSAKEEKSRKGIQGVLGYRVFKGNEQWRVRWEGEGEEQNTWEVWGVLDTSELRAHAERLRESHGQP